jgi:hypothetical protein
MVTNLKYGQRIAFKSSGETSTGIVVGNGKCGGGNGGCWVVMTKGGPVNVWTKDITAEQYTVFDDWSEFDFHQMQKLPHTKWHDVANRVINILMDERQVSEKSFGAIDAIKEEVTKMLDDDWFYNTVISNDLERTDFLAEMVYRHYWQDKKTEKIVTSFAHYERFFTNKKLVD